ATVLSTVVDGVLVVARGGRTRRRHLRTLRSRLARARAPIVGVVLNGGDDTSAPARPYPTTVERAPAPAAAPGPRGARARGRRRGPPPPPPRPRPTPRSSSRGRPPPRGPSARPSASR